MFGTAGENKVNEWVNDWCLFAKQYLRVSLDKEQEQVLRSVQHNPKTTVASGTSRGKDYVAAVAALCFLYLTPRWDAKDKTRLVDNTKVVMTAPTDRQVGEIMVPEIHRIFNHSAYLPGYLSGYGIKTGYEEWFLTGFKSDDKKTESWSGYHAANMMFIVTEASGISQTIFDAIEGNLQGNSRLLIVFNPNINSGYAAASFKDPTFKKFRLNSLNAVNVQAKQDIIPGQVGYVWVKDRISGWCSVIRRDEYRAEEGDFEFEGTWYRPNDLFRAKILGLFPKVSEGVLVPPEWITIANDRWKLQQQQQWGVNKPLRLGVDVAGMGRDNSCLCYRFGDYVEKFTSMQGGGTANHMEVAGNVYTVMKLYTDSFVGTYAQSFIDTIGEGAGCYSRLVELATEKPENAWLKDKVHSCKFSESAIDGVSIPMKDVTGIYEFLNMRSWSYWAVRDWLDPSKGSKAMLPPDDQLFQELSETQWKFRSDGKIQIEAKEELKKRIKRSPDKADALANTFWPIPDIMISKKKKQNVGQFFH